MEIDDRLRLAYAIAMKAQHDGARVEIHMGIHVLEHLREHATHQVANWVPHVAPTVFGFPIQVRDSFPPTRVEVHTVQAIA